MPLSQITASHVFFKTSVYQSAYLKIIFLQPTESSIITGYLTDEFAKSQNGFFKDIQLGDCLSNIASGKAATTVAIISFKFMEDKLESVEEISFVDLHKKVVRLASVMRGNLLPHLQQQNVDLNSEVEQGRTTVAAYITTGINRVYIQLACMHLRLAYIPMDSNLSKERMNFLCNSLRPIAFITDDPSVRIENTQISTYFVDELLRRAESNDALMVEPLFKNVENPVVLLLFTSGSTSPIPKGIPLRNSQMANRLSWQWSPASPLVEITGASLAKTSWLFVDAFTEMFGPLLGGRPIVVSGTSRITSERLVADVEILGFLVDRFQIAQITSVPTQLESWMNQIGDDASSFKTLRVIVSSGQMLPFSLANRIFEVFKQRNLKLLNFYGSTEVAGDVTAIAFDSKEEVYKSAIKLPTGGFVLPVGKPIYNTEMYVVAEDGTADSSNIAELGSEGEVLVSGAGTLNEEPIVFSQVKKPAATLETNSLSKMACFSRLFHTGDVGFICPKNGNLYITGRLDDVVKVNGVKVAVGNVDQILAGLDRGSGKFINLGATVTLALEKGETGTRLVCFYKSGDDDAFTEADLAEALRIHFTTFLNVTFVKVPSFPIQRQSGKIDKMKLKQDYQKGIFDKKSVASGYKRIATDRREIIRRIFANHLGLSEAAQKNGEPDDDADFFLIGGDSIIAASLLAELRKEGFKANMNIFAEHRKMGDLLNALTNETTQHKNAELHSGKNKFPFVQQYQPGKTFALQPSLDAHCRDLIANVIADSFVKLEPMVAMINLSRETMYQIVTGRLKQFEELPGLVFVAGYSSFDPNGPLSTLLDDISAVALAYPSDTPNSPGVNDPLYFKIEKAFEICDSMGGELEDASKCFTSGLLGAKTGDSGGGDTIQLTILLEKAMIEGVRRMGYRAIRSINTSIVTRIMSQELGYVLNCTVNIAEIFEKLGVNVIKKELLVDVTTRWID
ncbi:hypothetical protein Aperf_G00000001682 [Anoplocephala perfoliata]